MDDLERPAILTSQGHFNAENLCTDLCCKKKMKKREDGKLCLRSVSRARRDKEEAKANLACNNECR
jgi:hypothetical protein